MGPTRRFTIASSAGVFLACSIGSSPSWRLRAGGPTDRGLPRFSYCELTLYKHQPACGSSSLCASNWPSLAARLPPAKPDQQLDNEQRCGGFRSRFLFHHLWIRINARRSEIISMLNREHSYWYSREVPVVSEVPRRSFLRRGKCAERPDFVLGTQSR